MRLLEVLFFTGLAGCTIAVALSWISIFKSGFADTQESAPAERRSAPPEQSYRLAKPDV
jgi:hypothetical protein